MKRLILSCILVFACFVATAQAQKPTTITRVEVDGEVVKSNYKVLFLCDRSWIEAENTPTGFIVPKEIGDQQKLTFRFIFNDHDLEFSAIDRSILGIDWIVGVDLPPYSEEFVKPKEMAGVTEVYYLQYGAAQLVVTIREPKAD